MTDILVTTPIPLNSNVTVVNPIPVVLVTGSGGLTIADNGDGTLTLGGNFITDNLDGTLTLTIGA